MIIEICVGVATVAFVILSVFLVMALRTAMQILKKARQVLGKIDHELPEASRLIKNANELTLDVKRKADSLNFLFRPLTHLSKKRPGKHKGSHKLEKILDYVEEAIVLFKKFKEK